MGHHINGAGEFQSDKYDLQPDRITINFRNPASHSALAALAENYKWIDPGLSEDIRARLSTVVKHPDFIRKTVENSMKTMPIMLELVGNIFPAVKDIFDKEKYLHDFVKEIQHGNSEHQLWLRQAAVDYNKGFTVKRPRGL